MSNFVNEKKIDNTFLQLEIKQFNETQQLNESNSVKVSGL